MERVFQACQGQQPEGPSEGLLDPHCLGLCSWPDSSLLGLALLSLVPDGPARSRCCLRMWVCTPSG